MKTSLPAESSTATQRGLLERIDESNQVCVLGVGTGSPRLTVDWRTSADFAKTTSARDDQDARRIEILYRRSGIVERGSVVLDVDPDGQLVSDFYDPASSELDRGPTTAQRNQRFAREAPDLAVAASRQALDRSGVAADEITHLITVSCTGFSSPGIDIALIDRLGLPRTTERTQVGFMGCHAAINAIRVARGLVLSDPLARVLICSVEICTLHYQYGYDADKIVTNALFADGAGAMILGDIRSSERAPRNAVAPSPGEPSASTDVGRKPGSGELGSVVATGSYLLPDSRDAMTWRIGDHGFEMTLSAQVPQLIEEHLQRYLTDWLGQQNESIASIGGWAVHPGGTRILSAVDSALELDAGATGVSRSVLAHHGNMSSATLLFVLEQFSEIGQPRPWVMLGFGPGLEVEVALIR